MSETDRRLKDHLNTNQATRERMCLELLSIMPDFSNVRPRLPKGGPDGGADIQATYKEEWCVAAVGFVNDATDLSDHRKQIQKKFRDDLSTAATCRDSQGKSPRVFVFFTNVGLTPSITADMKKSARAIGFSYCDVVDREIMRMLLDSNKGYAIRFRYLDIPLNDAEQKDFFGTWADQLNAVISSGIRGVDQTAKRLQFLLEAQFNVDSVITVIRLDNALGVISGGEFVFQTQLSFRTHCDGLLGLCFGGGNNPIKQSIPDWDPPGRGWPQNDQYGYGNSWLLPETPQHRHHLEIVGQSESDATKDEHWVRTFESSRILEIDKEHLVFQSGTEPFLFRFAPTFKLMNLDSSMIIFDCSRKIAEHIEEITMFANGYRLLHLEKSAWKIEKGSFERFQLPPEATQVEADADWVTIRPIDFVSCFTIDLMNHTPKRFDW